jgi:dTDP-4-dehydrorhamnose 3,5-epimerase-like enzyme
MKKNSVLDCKVIPLSKIHNRAGNITIVEGEQSIPFEIKRVYYLYDVPGGECRGGHAHKTLYQLIVAANGSFDVVLDDGKKKRKITLNQPYHGLFVVPGIWRELINFSSGSNCLVLASHKYDEDDYMRNYNEFLIYKNRNELK